jgi:hypothetical protein
MDYLALLLLLAVLIIVASFVMTPFGENWRDPVQKGQALSALMAERDRILAAVQELDSDLALGKIPAEEYPGQRASLLQEGANVLRQLDEAQKLQVRNSPQPVRRANQGGRLAPASAQRQWTDEELEDLIALRRSARKEATKGFCPKCGKPVLKTDQFCPSCGQALTG